MRKRRARKPFVPRPALTTAQVLVWADDFHRRTGRWPKTIDGAVPADRNEKWLNLDMALRHGYRGLPGGDSLARLLQRERSVRNKQAVPPLTEDGVLAWAEGHHRRTGRWPNEKNGFGPGAPDDPPLRRERYYKSGPRPDGTPRPRRLVRQRKKPWRPPGLHAYWASDCHLGVGTGSGARIGSDREKSTPIRALARTATVRV